MDTYVTKHRLHALGLRALLAAALVAPGLASATDSLRLLNLADSGWNTLPLAIARPGMSFDVRNQQDPAIAQFNALAATPTRSGEIAPGVEILRGDFDGDGRSDIALLNRDPNALPRWTTMPVAFANSDGSVRIGYVPLGAFADAVADWNAEVVTGDFNGDRITDVALVRRVQGWGNAPMLLSQPGGTHTNGQWNLGAFAGWATLTYGYGQYARIVVGDFNHDGRSDMAMVNPCGYWNTIPVAYAQPQSGTFAIANVYAAPFAESCTDTTVDVLAGDFNGDGHTDLARFSADGMVIASGTTSSFTTTTHSLPGFAYRARTAKVLTGRFDSGPSTDIALIDTSGAYGSIAVGYINATGQLAWAERPAPDFAAWARMPGVRPLVGDFDGNGMSDIALVGWQTDWLTIPIAYFRLEWVPTGTCGKDFCNHLPTGSWVPKVVVRNDEAPGFANWARVPGVWPLVGDFGS
jgi:hypothetical protein